MSDHIPDPGQHRTILYGHYANRVRGARQHHEAEMREGPAELPRRRCSPSWARLIAKVYHVDPLVCSRCGQKMQMIAFLTDQLSIRRILDHLGLSPPEQAKPPPVREILRVAEHDDRLGCTGRVGLSAVYQSPGPQPGDGFAGTVPRQQQSQSLVHANPPPAGQRHGCECPAPSNRRAREPRYDAMPRGPAQPPI